MLDGPGWYSRKARMTYLALAAFLLTFLAPMGVSYDGGSARYRRARAGRTVSFTLRTLPRGLTVVFMVREALRHLCCPGRGQQRGGGRNRRRWWPRPERRLAPYCWWLWSSC